MKVQGYSVRIVNKTETSEGYVPMRDRETFRIELLNDSGRRCCAEVRLNGKFQGSFVLDAWRRYEPLERGVEDSGLFTFFKLGTSDARAAGLPDVSRDDTGLLQVTFKPERVQEVRRSDHTLGAMRGGNEEVYCGGGAMRGGSSTRSFSAGGVGLTGSSNQRFSSTSFDVDPDTSKYVTISLRLVCDDSEVRPLGGNKVPAPLF